MIHSVIAQYILLFILVNVCVGSQLNFLALHVCSVWLRLVTLMLVNFLTVDGVLNLPRVKKTTNVLDASSVSLSKNECVNRQLEDPASHAQAQFLFS